MNKDNYFNISFFYVSCDCRLLPNIIKTEFMLGIHDDGFVINPNLWTDQFLKYDYIGAPWSHTIPYYGQKYRVGNGGFSLRFPVLKHVYTNGRDC